ncbi:TonB-dependent hemoglobin/transferrin/lactoferrin family receptor [Xenorhabdus sp. 42]|uniref:TonB-dependent hemoglobin/transferrin/lactoferrin family receptor n=1 Tax=Xenorhabdus szentirmaii TaxID=290112 RepID=UPI0019C3F41C|nr:MULTISPECIES: TonB-dependent hemoglobin/transferrin/lactoferrin family receptor [unclassified Xenorhabdus]MBD2793398.1 TonB-dependent hemoglobin/transferrin/lactoferrin family receptor [Xenorhabdus sp. CUL]MBD2819594.1 TonB-dependent hemoglobin/transferrin/lactoferrin family receptor [Xenorhabdus sp. 42]MBD2825790.1 TonB-dependent hemoglobin/transferrin/lactoferrin family receptor [Xenorhabdus sp. 5]
MASIKPSNLKLSTLSVVILASLSSANAATPPSEEKHTPSTDILTVYATGNQRDSFEAPMMVTVIENNSATSRVAGNANELLSKIPGIEISGAGRANGQDINMRGYGPKGVLTLVDGIRQGTDTGHIGGVFLDPALIKQVEVVRGPSALLHGNGALGGVIAFQTVDAADLLEAGRNHGFRVFSRATSGDHSLGFGGSAFGKTEQFDGLFAFGTRDVGNIRYGSGLQGPNDETMGNLLAKGAWKIDDSQKISGNLRYYHNETHQPKNPQKPFATKNTDAWVKRTTSQRDAQLTYQLNPSAYNWLNAQADIYYSDININTKSKKRGFEGRQQETYGIKLENRSHLATTSFAAHQFTYGGEIYKQKQKPSSHIVIGFPDASIRFASGWFQDEITLRDLPVSLIAGTRYDNYTASNSKYPEINTDKWSSKGAISITPTDWSMLFASYAQAFRAPSMGEIYNDSMHYAFMNWTPNPNLRPESNATQEYGFGLRFDDVFTSNDGLKFKASYFDTHAKDYITSHIDFKKGLMQSINIPKSKIWGWDVTMTYGSDWFTWDLAYNRTKGKDEKTGESIAALSPDTVTSTLDIPLPNTNFSIGWIGQFARHTQPKGVNGTDIDSIGLKVHQYPGYGTNDFYISYHGNGIFKGLTTSAVLANAFDKEYYSPQGTPQSGRNAKLFVSYQW